MPSALRQPPFLASTPPPLFLSNKLECLLCAWLRPMRQKLVYLHKGSHATVLFSYAPERATNAEVVQGFPQVPGFKTILN